MSGCRFFCFSFNVSPYKIRHFGYLFHLYSFRRAHFTIGRFSIRNALKLSSHQTFCFHVSSFTSHTVKRIFLIILLRNELQNFKIVSLLFLISLSWEGYSEIEQQIVQDVSCLI